MEKDGYIRFLFGVQAMQVPLAQRVMDDMAEQFLAERAEQRILGLKMIVKGGSPYVGPVDDLLDGDFIIGLLGKQLSKR